MKYFLNKPEHIKISLTNVCNYRCIMCYNPTLKQKRGFISDKLLYGILDECKRLGIHKVSLGATGEPLMHKGFIDYLRYAKSLGLWVSTCTNCSLLTKEIAELLISQKIDRITLSNYSADCDEHFKYTGTDLFDQVVENIRYFLTVWHRGKGNTRVLWDFLEIPGVNNYSKFVRFWGPIAKRVGLAPFHIPLRLLQNWGGRNNQYHMNPPSRAFWRKSGKDGNCLVWQSKIRCPNIISCLYVGYDGSVYPCCNIPEAEDCKEVEFGNLNKNGIMDVWHSDKYLKFKKDHYQMDISKYTPCRLCSVTNPVRSVQLSFHGVINFANLLFSKLKIPHTSSTLKS